MPLSQLVTVREILATTKINRTTLWRMIQDGRFPPQSAFPSGVSAGLKTRSAIGLMRGISRQKSKSPPALRWGN